MPIKLAREVVARQYFACSAAKGVLKELVMESKIILHLSLTGSIAVVANLRSLRHQGLKDLTT
jgi:hypothetical protein